MDDSFKNAVREAMDHPSRKWDQKTLARELKVSGPSITNLFKPGLRQITFKARIEALFGWTPSDELKRVLDRISRSLAVVPIENAEKLAGFLESSVVKPQSGSH